MKRKVLNRGDESFFFVVSKFYMGDYLFNTLK